MPSAMALEGFSFWGATGILDGCELHPHPGHPGVGVGQAWLAVGTRP